MSHCMIRAFDRYAATIEEAERFARVLTSCRALTDCRSDMPVYDYACAECGAFEVIRCIADRDAATRCPRCEKPAERVTVGAPSLGGSSSDGGDDTGSYGLRHRGGCLCCN